MKAKSAFSIVTSIFILGILPLLSMIPNLVVNASVYEKITIYGIMLVINLLVFILVWISFRFGRKSIITKTMMPRCDCYLCENLLCCFRAIRPGVNYREKIFNLESSEFIDEFALASIEAKNQIKEVWILSPDLSYECKDSFFTEVVRRNMHRGIKYKYISQSNADSRENSKRIYNKYTNRITKRLYKKRLAFYLANIPELDIILNLYSIVVYNPSPDDRHKRHVYLCVGENEDNIHSVYKEIKDQTYINKAIDTIRSVIYLNTPISFTKEH